MARLTWDGTGEKFFETGTKYGVLYTQNDDGTYAEGVEWNGLTGVTENPTGAEANKLWADNDLYADLRSAEELEGSITAYTYPDEFAQCDGSAVPVDGVYIGQQKRRKFGLCYRTEVGNDVSDNLAYKLHIIYGATASPSEKGYTTINDSPEAVEFSWDFTTTPVKVTKYNDMEFKNTASIVIDSRKFSTTELKAKLTALENILYGADNVYTATSDTSPVAGKTYYTKSGDVYSEFTGSTFANGTTYYELIGDPRLPLPDEVIDVLN